jgi:hypothetical protein
MPSVESLDLHIRPRERVRAKYTYTNGNTVEGMMTVENAKRIFGNVADIGIPTEFMTWKCIHYVKNSNRHQLVVIEPPRTWECVHIDYGTLLIDAPWIVYQGVVANDYISSDMFMATKTNPIEQLVTNGHIDTYYIPMGNVYDDMHVCWGDAGPPVVKKMSHCLSIITRFFQTPFNNDLDGQSYGGEAGRWRRTMGDLYDSVRDTDEPMHFKIDPELLDFNKQMVITDDIPPNVIYQ